jgi:hypothetical protein
LPLQAGIFGLDARKGIRTRFQAGKIGLQHIEDGVRLIAVDEIKIGIGIPGAEYIINL